MKVIKIKAQKKLNLHIKIFSHIQGEGDKEPTSGSALFSKLTIFVLGAF